MSLCGLANCLTSIPSKISSKYSKLLCSKEVQRTFWFEAHLHARMEQDTTNETQKLVTIIVSVLLLQIKVMPLNTKDLIFVLARYFCPKHFFGLVYFVVINKFCSVLFKYSGKYMFSELSVLFTWNQSYKFPKYINNRVV